MTGLHIDSVIKHFGLRSLLSDIYLSCQPGEIVGLLGRNGSGKSSLLKIIFGSLSAENKFVRIDGKTVQNLHNKSNLLVYLPQHNFLPNHLNIKTIINLFCTSTQAELLGSTDLIKPLLNQNVKSLSVGERRIVEIMLMVFAEAKYVLLDEPFSALAPLHIEFVKKMIREHGKCKGFIITDHDYRNIIDVSTSVVLLRDGKTINVNHLKDLVDLGYLPASANLGL